MTATAFIEPSASDAAAGSQSGPSAVLDLGELRVGLPPLLGLVPGAGPQVFVYVGFGVALLLLLVPPITLLATLAAVAAAVAAALVVLAVLVVAILRALFVLARLIRGHRLGHFSVPVPQVHNVKARRV
jgi:hypothetical protein